MALTQHRNKKIVSNIDYDADYLDPYNMRIQWMSAQRPITGPWKLFAEDQFFRELTDEGDKYHLIAFDNAIRTMGAKRTLAFALIIKSYSYVDGLLDCLSLITDNVCDKSNKHIQRNVNERNVERYEDRQAWFDTQ